MTHHNVFVCRLVHWCTFTETGLCCSHTAGLRWDRVYIPKLCRYVILIVSAACRCRPTGHLCTCQLGPCSFFLDLPSVVCAPPHAVCTLDVSHRYNSGTNYGVIRRNWHAMSCHRRVHFQQHNQSQANWAIATNVHQASVNKHVQVCAAMTLYASCAHTAGSMAKW